MTEDKATDRLLRQLEETKKALEAEVSRNRDLKEELQRSEADRREVEERFRVFSELSFEGITISENGRFVDANSVFVEIFGYEIGELLGAEISMLVAPQDRERVLARIRSGYERPYEHRALRKDGTLIDVEVCGRTIRYRGRECRLTAIHDITERRTAERQRQELAKADKMIALGTLVSGLAHEINNPNHLLMLNLPILRQAWDDALPVLEKQSGREPGFRLANLPFEEMRREIPELIEDMLEGTHRIKTIITALRDYSQEDLVSDSPGLVVVRHVVRSALTLLANPIRQATDRFAADYDEDLPAVWGNVQRLEQVVINLVLNACQAMTDRSRAIMVTTHHDPLRNRVEIVVRDEGRGICEADLDHLTDPFFTTRREQGGTGLGLAVAARIVAEHGGELSHESEVGRGTTARLSLPAWSESGDGPTA